jgi:hypothetical protein
MSLLLLHMAFHGGSPAPSPEMTVTPSNSHRTLAWTQTRRVNKRGERFRPREYEKIEKSVELDFTSTCGERFDLLSVRGVEEEFDDDNHSIHPDQVLFVVKKEFNGSGEPPAIILRGGGEFEADTGEFVDFAGWHEEGYRIKGRVNVRNLERLTAAELRCK